MRHTSQLGADHVPDVVGWPENPPAATPAGTARRPMGKRARIAARPTPVDPARLARQSASVQARVAAIAGRPRPPTPPPGPTPAVRVAGRRNPPPAPEYVVVRRTDERRAQAERAAIIAATFPR